MTKVGNRRDSEGGWPKALAPDELRQAVHENLENLDVDALDVVNLRVGGLDSPEPGSLTEPFTALAELQQDRSDHAPGRQHRLGRADRRSTIDRADCVRAEPLQPRQPGRR